MGCVYWSYGIFINGGAIMNAMEILAIALIIVGLILAAVEVVRSSFQSLVAWGVVAIAIGLLIQQL